MRLYLLRHGTAAPHGEGEADADRALVSKGVDQCTEVARLLERMGIRPQAILSSPYRRALESAQVVASMMKWEGEITEETTLEPGTAVKSACRALLAPRYLDHDYLLAVGHEPLMSSITGHLIGQQSLQLDLRKGGLVELGILAGPIPRGVLLGLIRPAYLRNKHI